MHPRLESSESWNNAIVETDGIVAEIVIRRKECHNIAESEETEKSMDATD